jgi:hypothetical protein
MLCMGITVGILAGHHEHTSTPIKANSAVCSAEAIKQLPARLVNEITAEELKDRIAYQYHGYTVLSRQYTTDGRPVVAWVQFETHGCGFIGGITYPKGYSSSKKYEEVVLKNGKAYSETANHTFCTSDELPKVIVTPDKGFKFVEVCSRTYDADALMKLVLVP